MDGVSIAVKKGATGIVSFANLAGKTVIAGADTPAIPLIKKMAPTAKIITFVTDPDCVQALHRRPWRCVCAGLRDAGWAMLSQANPISIVGHQVNDGYLGIGVPKDQPTMVTFVNNWLKMIEKNGTVGRAPGRPPSGLSRHPEIWLLLTVGTVPGVPSSLLG